jgi:hypothetical protein
MTVYKVYCGAPPGAQHLANIKAALRSKRGNSRRCSSWKPTPRPRENDALERLRHLQKTLWAREHRRMAVETSRFNTRTALAPSHS